MPVQTIGSHLKNRRAPRMFGCNKNLAVNSNIQKGLMNAQNTPSRPHVIICGQVQNLHHIIKQKSSLSIRPTIRLYVCFFQGNDELFLQIIEAP